MTSLKDNRVLLLSLTIALLVIGFMFVYSAGSLQAIRIHRADTYFLNKQLISSMLGFCLLLVAYKVPLDTYRRFVMPIYFFTFVLLIVVFFQRPINGAHRWIQLPIYSFQPSELAKFTVVLYLAHYLDKKNERLSDFGKGFLPATILVGLLAGLILLEPDFGTTFLLALVAFTLFVVGGVRARHLLGVVGFCAPILMMSLFFGYRRGRLLVFLDPWPERLGGGYQLIQSLGAVGSGGFLGKGIGNSTQKLLFLPEAHTDFIYAIISEELGLIGALAVFLIIVIFFRVAIVNAFRHTDMYKKLLLTGISVLLFYQSLINIGVVLGMLPTKGIPLPFVSYGGSSLMISLFFVGVILRGIEELE